MTNRSDTTDTTTDRAAELRTRIADIRAAAFGMGHEPNAGQAERIRRLEAELAQLEAKAQLPAKTAAKLEQLQAELDEAKAKAATSAHAGWRVTAARGKLRAAELQAFAQAPAADLEARLAEGFGKLTSAVELGAVAGQIDVAAMPTGYKMGRHRGTSHDRVVTAWTGAGTLSEARCLVCGKRGSLHVTTRVLQATAWLATAAVSKLWAAEAKATKAAELKAKLADGHKLARDLEVGDSVVGGRYVGYNGYSAVVRRIEQSPHYTTRLLVTVEYDAAKVRDAAERSYGAMHTTTTTWELKKADTVRMADRPAVPMTAAEYLATFVVLEAQKIAQQAADALKSAARYRGDYYGRGDSAYNAQAAEKYERRAAERAAEGQALEAAASTIGLELAGALVALAASAPAPHQPEGPRPGRYHRAVEAHAQAIAAGASAIEAAQAALDAAAPEAYLEAHALAVAELEARADLAGGQLALAGTPAPTRAVQPALLEVPAAPPAPARLECPGQLELDFEPGPAVDPWG